MLKYSSIKRERKREGLQRLGDVDQTGTTTSISIFNWTLPVRSNDVAHGGNNTVKQIVGAVYTMLCNVCTGFSKISHAK